jgi:hypothetical protein
VKRTLPMAPGDVEISADRAPSRVAVEKDRSPRDSGHVWTAPRGQGLLSGQSAKSLSGEEVCPERGIDAGCEAFSA